MASWECVIELWSFACLFLFFLFKIEVNISNLKFSERNFETERCFEEEKENEEEGISYESYH